MLPNLALHLNLFSFFSLPLFCFTSFYKKREKLANESKDSSVSPVSTKIINHSRDLSFITIYNSKKASLNIRIEMKIKIDNLSSVRRH